MVSIPKEALLMKVTNPNTINEDGSVTINRERFSVGDILAHVCVRTGRTKWGKMFRNVKLKEITPYGKNNAKITLEGTSDWEKAEITTELCQII